jgi:WD40 repeat protein
VADALPTAFSHLIGSSLAAIGCKLVRKLVRKLLQAAASRPGACCESRCTLALPCLHLVLPPCTICGADSGPVSYQRVARLCGEHSQHAYDALRVNLHGTTCVGVSFMLGAPHLLACTTRDNALALLDTSRRRFLGVQPRGPRRLRHVHDGALTTVAVFGDPLAPAIELQLWRGTRYLWLEGHTTEVRCCAISCDGGLLISGTSGGQTLLWTISCTSKGETTGGLEPPEVAVHRSGLPGHAGGTAIRAVAMAARGGSAASASADGTVLLWDLSHVQRGVAPGAVGQATAPSPVACGDVSGAAAGPHSRGNLPVSTTDCVAAAVQQPFLEQQQQQQTDSLNSTTTSQQQEQQQQQPPPEEPAAQLAARLQVQSGDEPCTLALSADGVLLAVGCRSGRLLLGGAGRDGLLPLPQHHQEGCRLRCAAFSPNGSLLLSGGDDMRAVLWDVAVAAPLLVVHEHVKPLYSCAWSDDGARIATTGV